MKERILSRRDLIRMSGFSLAAVVLLPSCNPASSTNTSASGSGDDSNVTSSTGACGEIPSETAGPYPAHDDRGINCLTLSGIERSDIRTSLNAGAYPGTATASGIPLTIRLRVVDAANGCTPLAGYAVYLWQCDANGKYSMYSSGVTTQTYLRGVQESDANGWVTFTTIFPGCYSGRMTHIHFEVYPSIAQAIDQSYAAKTSQLSFPTSVSSNVYNHNSAYSASISNLANISFGSDNVFSDGTTYQIASIDSGTYTSGYVASLVVGV